jgi:Cupin domain.
VPLECREVGITIARCEPGWSSQPHDHTEDDHKEVYVLINGAATVRVDDEDVPMEGGDVIWISPAATRQIQNGDEESALVPVSAPSDGDDSGKSGPACRLSGFQG